LLNGFAIQVTPVDFDSEWLEHLRNLLFHFLNRARE
jgi:hypothetical protein